MLELTDEEWILKEVSEQNYDDYGLPIKSRTVHKEVDIEATLKAQRQKMWDMLKKKFHTSTGAIFIPNYEVEQIEKELKL